MKATERGQGGLHGSQFRSAGQSEEAASAYGSSQVAADHQDFGKTPFNTTFVAAGFDLSVEMTHTGSTRDEEVAS